MGLEDDALKILEEVHKKCSAEHLGLRISKKNEIPQYIRGKEAEEKINNIITQKFPQIELIDDVYFNLSEILKPINGYEPTMQIDHLAVSDHVIYAIETKSFNENAEIGGTPYTKNWEYSDDITKKTIRENAIRQNKYHIDNLRKVLHLKDDVNIISIVCFVGIKETNIKVSTNYGTYVICVEELPLYLNLLETKYSECIVEKAEIVDAINKLNIKCFVNEVNHIIYTKLLKRRAREASKGKRKRKKKS